MKLSCLIKKLIHDLKEPFNLVGFIIGFMIVTHLIAYGLTVAFPITTMTTGESIQFYWIIECCIMLLAFFVSWFYSWVTGAIDYCRRFD